MPQHDLILDNGSGAAFRADANSALAALGSYMKGPNAPPAPMAGMVWVDDDTPSATTWTVKRYDGADWIEEGRLDIMANIYIPSEGVIAWADVASAATVDLGAQASRSLRLTGTTSISSFGTSASGVRKRLRIASGLTITHNATSLFCPGAANLVLLAGDILDVESLGSGNWVVADVMPANGWRGAPVVLAEAVASASASLDITGVFSDTYDRYELELLNLLPAVSDGTMILRVGTGAGPTWQSGSSYNNAFFGITDSSSGIPASLTTAIYLSWPGGGGAGVSNVAATGGVSGRVSFCNPEVATVYPSFDVETRHIYSTGPRASSIRGSGIYAGAAAITGLRVLSSLGNITSGSIRLLGYRK
jgi:hypothetical protein